MPGLGANTPPECQSNRRTKGRRGRPVTDRMDTWRPVGAVTGCPNFSLASDARQTWWKPQPPRPSVSSAPIQGLELPCNQSVGAAAVSSPASIVEPGRRAPGWYRQLHGATTSAGMVDPTYRAPGLTTRGPPFRFPLTYTEDPYEARRSEVHSASGLSPWGMRRRARSDPATASADGPLSVTMALALRPRRAGWMPGVGGFEELLEPRTVCLRDHSGRTERM
jgi:hypothetical protein